MNCNSANARIDAYLDGELSGRDIAELRSHIDECVECAESETAARAVKRALGAAPMPAPNSDFELRLSRAIEDESRRSRRKRTVTAPLLAAVALAAMLSTIATLSVGNRHRLADQAKQRRAEAIDFDIQRDQASFSNSDPLSGRAVVVQAAYGRR